jgi:DtxR family Mn-dependent transcriptional regulator
MATLTASIEDYIKAIYALEAEHERATTQRIAQRLDVRMASVTGMVKHLAAEGYLRHKPYHGVRLTEKGRAVALNLLRRHRLIELFLVKTLGLSWDAVDADADVLEHAVSDTLIERIYEYLGQPEFDPHGAPIPKKDGSLPTATGVSLDRVPVGVSATVLEVSDRDADFLRYLTELGIKLGSRIRITDTAPFDGPITLALRKRRFAIGAEAARRIRVCIDDTKQTTRTKPRPRR